ncbi:MAG: hypothetical protein CMF62_00815 [Magnetococcales bacterium]|nr:hypothetical protein [Magnetococcales bacterium]|tara:strand:+ start:2336 stop:2680 length:345 start_codon:yes stop_codon:yes gene_type:complete
MLEKKELIKILATPIQNSIDAQHLLGVETIKLLDECENKKVNFKYKKKEVTFPVETLINILSLKINNVNVNYNEKKEGLDFNMKIEYENNNVIGLDKLNEFLKDSLIHEKFKLQ